MNLPEIYRRVCEKRPEAAVLGLKFHRSEPHCDFWLWKRGPKAIERITLGEEAEGMILIHWVCLLPYQYALRRGSNTWQVVYVDPPEARNFSGREPHTTPLEALAAYLEQA